VIANNATRTATLRLFMQVFLSVFTASPEVRG
jgi:hypothetical protein